MQPVGAERRSGRERRDAARALPNVVATSDWVAAHAGDAGVRVVEVDVDTAAYDEGHVPGAAPWSWTKELCDTVVRDIVPGRQFEELLGRTGIDNATTIVLYGDQNNRFAAWAFWQLKIYGHGDVRIMDGGRRKWLAERRELSTARPACAPTSYRANTPDLTLRAFLPDVQRAVERQDALLVDVRSPEEYSGAMLAPPGVPETCQRGGHVPGAVNLPWERACREDGTFRSADELAAVVTAAGIDADRPVMTYCRIGERASHTWFVLKYLLGFPHVMNYDGSWTEWGNLVGAPVERT